MKPLLLLSLLLSISLIGSSQCANTSNIYSFVFHGKNYEVVKELKSWSQASSCAVQRGGHLVHIDSLVEQNAVYNAITIGAAVPSNYVSVNDGGGAAYVWIGGTDQQTEGTWLWDGDNNNVGTNFWTGQGAAGTNNGVVIGNAFVNWGGNSVGPYNEPDNYLNVQDGCGMALSNWPYGIASEWNDINPTNLLYYVIEYENNIGIPKLGMNEFNLKLFPDPATTTLSFEIPQNIKTILSLRIISIDGKEVFKKIDALNESSFDVSLLDDGIYFIVLETADDRIYRGKFVKQ